MGEGLHLNLKRALWDPGTEVTRLAPFKSLSKAVELWSLPYVRELLARPAKVTIGDTDPDIHTH